MPQATFRSPAVFGQRLTWSEADSAKQDPEAQSAESLGETLVDTLDTQIDPEAPATNQTSTDRITSDVFELSNAPASSNDPSTIDPSTTDTSDASAFAVQGTSADVSGGITIDLPTQTSSSVSTNPPQTDDMNAGLEMSRQIRARILAAAGNCALGYSGSYPGGILSLLA